MKIVEFLLSWFVSTSRGPRFFKVLSTYLFPSFFGKHTKRTASWIFFKKHTLKTGNQFQREVTGAPLFLLFNSGGLNTHFYVLHSIGHLPKKVTSFKLEAFVIARIPLIGLANFEIRSMYTNSRFVSENCQRKAKFMKTKWMT